MFLSYSEFFEAHYRVQTFDLVPNCWLRASLQFLFRFLFLIPAFGISRVHTHNIACYSIRILNVSVLLAFAYNPQRLYFTSLPALSPLTDAICIYCQVCTIIKLAYFATKRNGRDGCEKHQLQIQIRVPHDIPISQSFALLRAKTLSALNFPRWCCCRCFSAAIYFSV